MRECMLEGRIGGRGLLSLHLAEHCLGEKRRRTSAALTCVPRMGISARSHGPVKSRMADTYVSKNCRGSKGYAGAQDSEWVFWAIYGRDSALPCHIVVENRCQALTPERSGATNTDQLFSADAATI